MELTIYTYYLPEHSVSGAHTRHHNILAPEKP